ncbi:MAG: ECF transporter S component [Polyangia bacterium]|jgi:hypothetical protein|nr:ECF transporter S component [Polyangia bacterium]
MRLFASPRELAYCGVFGAVALLLPVVFHALHLGRLFMPMYLPLVALGFFVGPLPAAATAFLVPLLSGAVTGMPPFYPPVAFLMAVELAIMSGLIAVALELRPRTNEWLLLLPTLVLGRVLYLLMVYGLASIIDLPASFVTGVSLLGGWPGLCLMIVVIPPLARLARRRRRLASRKEMTL